jgi:hypothetical protein
MEDLQKYIVLPVYVWVPRKTISLPCKTVVPNVRSRPKSGSRGVSRRVARGFYGELDNYEKKLISQFKQNDWENVITESVFINFTLTGAYVQYFTSFYLEANDLSNQHKYELLKQRLVSCKFCVFNTALKIVFGFDK